MTTAEHTEKFWLVVLVDDEQIAAYPDTKQGYTDAQQSLQQARWDYPLSHIAPTRLLTSQLDEGMLD